MKIPGIEFLVQALSPKPAKFSTNPVIAAIQDRDESKVRSLVSSGIDVNGFDPELGNGMHWIAEKGHYQYPPSGIPKLLVDSGLDLNAKNPAGSTALEISLLKGWQKIAMLLLDSGADRAVVTESVKSRLTCPDCKKVVRDNRL
jgi:ankyrin repeat protein